ncbi:ABC transporter ATP-binding protein [Roseateles violae]|uniref:ATP-binding cassette domain-containing protein n=1 Tax=Roseateles violae TaxID=3058042 RepID=A0ABT8DRI7_9BURK|nr:ATP-binding cassette domain-containing protein [Pelomonas sp. PFR6]MDN3920646.1 ATP-binding cassette domain-containing protein [Pelomonas sp. PFR6]
MAAPAAPKEALVRVEDLTIAYGRKLVQRGLSFEIRRGEVLVIMGGSGCGKSSLLRHLIGLQRPAAGRIRYGEEDINDEDPQQQARLRRGFGVSFQAGALWSSMTVGENVMLPLELIGGLGTAEREQKAREKLALVGLADQFDTEPAALSGGMRKRAAIARALALEPPLLYLDEPSAGLDPLSAARLDELMLALRDAQGATLVLVTHELPSIFAVADRALFLDAERKTMTALDAPERLLQEGPPEVREFLRRGAPVEQAATA